MATPFFVRRILSWVVGGAPKCQSYGVYLEEVQIRYLEKDSLPVLALSAQPICAQDSVFRQYLRARLGNH